MIIKNSEYIYIYICVCGVCLCKNSHRDIILSRITHMYPSQFFRYLNFQIYLKYYI